MNKHTHRHIDYGDDYLGLGIKMINWGPRIGIEMLEWYLGLGIRIND